MSTPWSTPTPSWALTSSAAAAVPMRLINQSIPLPGEVATPFGRGRDRWGAKTRAEHVSAVRFGDLLAAVSKTSHLLRGDTASRRLLAAEMWSEMRRHYNISCWLDVKMQARRSFSARGMLAVCQARSYR